MPHHVAFIATFQFFLSFYWKKIRLIKLGVWEKNWWNTVSAEEASQGCIKAVLYCPGKVLGLRKVPEVLNPIFKKGKKEDLRNSRSHLDHWERWCTNIPGNHFQTLKDKKMIGSSQNRFMKGKLCLTDLAALYSEMTGLMDEGRVIDVFYLSFSKVFDTISY